ncbi:hypothetical protein DL89DRAFT_28619 [Linderina pennispora]|uniref:Uncharacterized protein n=1 Tax=Linderina pennispora TaxID=61395 RepID=A0A1Y1W3X0_9FUNG|nr:uncharacterized protein DL89DRAFT_28619 [Linderina pennispora]ORX68239.1 hypothetical protein DL89DRAFT_28619 [Linderina pennispora]
MAVPSRATHLRVSMRWTPCACMANSEQGHRGSGNKRHGSNGAQLLLGTVAVAQLAPPRKRCNCQVYAGKGRQYRQRELGPLHRLPPPRHHRLQVGKQLHMRVAVADRHHTHVSGIQIHDVAGILGLGIQDARACVRVIRLAPPPAMAPAGIDTGPAQQPV